MKKAALTVIILTLITKLIGFGKEIVLSYFYGASNLSDAYLISLTIPTVIFSFIGIAINTTYIPIYNKIDKEKGYLATNEFTTRLINCLIIISTLVVMVVFLLAEPIVKLFASGFEGETLALAIDLTKISVFSIYTTSIVYVFIGYLNVKKSFIAPALLGLPLNFFLIISIILSTIWSITFLAYGKIIAGIAQLLFLLPFVYKKNFKYQFKVNFKDENLKRMLYLALPVILGTSINQINQLVDMTLASSIAVGGISALNYASRLNIFIEGVFIMSLSTVLYVSISRKAAEKDIIGLKKSLNEAISGINLVVIPAAVGAVIFAKPIVSLLFGRGAFDSQAILLTSIALSFYSIGLIGSGLREIFSRAFYALQDTKTPMINAAIGVLLNIILNIVLSQYLGIGGLALATSIASIFTMILMYFSLIKKIGSLGLKKISVSFIKVLLSALIMGIIAKISFEFFNPITSQSLSLILAVGIGGIIYFILISFMKIEEVDLIIKAFKRKLGL